MVKKKKREKKKEQGKEGTLEVSQTVSNVKAFIDKFKSDVSRKRKAYKSYALKFRKKRL